MEAIPELQATLFVTYTQMNNDCQILACLRLLRGWG